MSFLQGKPKTYDEHVAEALRDVKGGQHLRFINQLYKTKEVCLAAVKYESSHNPHPYDFDSVPMGNLDYVMEHMREILQHDSFCMRYLEKRYLERTEEEKEPDYYGDFNSYQDLLNHFGATSYDDMSRKRFAKAFGDSAP